MQGASWPRALELLTACLKKLARLGVHIYLCIYALGSVSGLRPKFTSYQGFVHVLDSTGIFKGLDFRPDAVTEHSF